jgi:hypothetical protein
MTKQRDFKALVRERMAKTGERYAVARAQVLSETAARVHPSPPPGRAYPGVLEGYNAFGGIQNGTAPLTNVLRQTGIAWGVTGQPFTETTVNGLCGGPGFLYAVFEYKGWPPLLSIALQSRSMPDAYIGQGLARLGVMATRNETTSPAAARKALEATLAAGKPALCAAGLRTVAVIGRDGDDWWIDGRAPVPTRLTSATLARVRGGYKPAKNRLTRIDWADAAEDPIAALRSAIVDTATAYVEPPVPRSFWVNCGFAGLEKWQRMLTDPKDKKAWPTLFDEGARAFAALKRTYEWVACFVAPGAGRPLYAEFLDDAARTLAEPSLRTAATAYREAGQLWSAFAEFVATVDDSAVRRACDEAERELEFLDADGDCHTLANPMDQMQLMERQRAAGADCRLTTAAARAIYAEMAARLREIVDAERAGVAAMTAIDRPDPARPSRTHPRGPA